MNGVSVTVVAEGANESATGTCTDSSNRTASNTVTGIDIDKTPPVLTLTSRTPANANGWNTGPVTAPWSCADALSGTATPTFSATVSTEGANQSASVSCADLAGNSASASAGGNRLRIHLFTHGRGRAGLGRLERSA